MKYENFEQIKKLVGQIDKHKENLRLIKENCSVIIKMDYSITVYTIGADSGSEHEYKNQAIGLIDYIKADLESRIEMLKGMLELL